MKKIISILLILSVLLIFASCGIPTTAKGMMKKTVSEYNKNNDDMNLSFVEMTYDSLGGFFGLDGDMPTFGSGYFYKNDISPNDFVCAVFKMDSADDAEEMAYYMASFADRSVQVCVVYDALYAYVCDNFVLVEMGTETVCEAMGAAFVKANGKEAEDLKVSGDAVITYDEEQ